MTYEDLLLDKEGGVATITLNVPEKLNAVTRTMAKNLPLVVDDIAGDDEIRVVILTGAGRGFCSGADVTSMRERMSSGDAVEISLHERLQVLGWPFADAFPRLNKPVIAAINGACVGGGFSLAMGCDIRIASETARFGVAQVARGLVPDYGLTFYLPQAIGPSRAMELMFTAGMIDAAEALRLGIVSRVVAADKLMEVTRELAGRMAQQSPFSTGLTKKMVWRGQLDGLTRQLDLETCASDICHQTEDHREGVLAFFEKRPPRFKGK